MTIPAQPHNGVMTRIMLDVEWGETPFTAGKDGWPAPLIRPRAYPDGANPAFYGEPIEAGDLLERYQRAEREFLALQAELTDLARRHGELE
jgi:hypothetical protein